MQKPADGPVRPDEAPRYRVTLLDGACATAEGIAHLAPPDPDRGDRGPQGEPERQPSLLAWSEVTEALAAEVGEPEGVRTIVFDLVVGVRGGDYRVCRLDADPGEDAMNLARTIEAGLGADVDSPSTKSVATDGTPSRWYPDLHSLAKDAVRILDDLSGD